MGLLVSPDRTSGLFRQERSCGTIGHVLGTRRQAWLDGLGQLTGQADRQSADRADRSDPIERLDPTALAARIGMRQKSDLSAAGPKSQPSQKSDGNAPWRKALRET